MISELVADKWPGFSRLKRPEVCDNLQSKISDIKVLILCEGTPTYMAGRMCEERSSFTELIKNMMKCEGLQWYSQHHQIRWPHALFISINQFENMGCQNSPSIVVNIAKLVIQQKGLVIVMGTNAKRALQTIQGISLRGDQVIYLPKYHERDLCNFIFTPVFSVANEYCRLHHQITHVFPPEINL